MNSQKRRSPYVKGPKRAAAAGKKTKKSAPASVKKEAVQAVPAKVPAKTPAKNIADFKAASSLVKNIPSLLTKSPDEMRTSINNVREWSSQMRGTMAEMEQTLGTLTSLIGMYERFANNRQRAGAQEAQADGDRSPLAFLKSLNNIDFRQILSLLNSPLVQALLEMNEITSSSSEEA
ncbi:hypothetical protein JQN58_17170 [Aneurinibacillus sp. BA2021]|nr:hypothetical protein [Aneurinibacillus sp. BA2021]